MELELVLELVLEQVLELKSKYLINFSIFNIKSSNKLPGTGTGTGTGLIKKI